MSYQKALEAAGAKVIQYEEFGSYQGDWWALVEFEGKRGWVHDYYGSCSGCDSFEAEEPRSYHHPVEKDSEGRNLWSNDPGHSKYPEYFAWLSEFGRGYLADILTQEQAEAKAGEFSHYGCDDAEVLEFVKANPV